MPEVEENLLDYQNTARPKKAKPRKTGNALIKVFKTFGIAKDKVCAKIE